MESFRKYLSGLLQAQSLRVETGNVKEGTESEDKKNDSSQGQEDTSVDPSRVCVLGSEAGGVGQHKDNSIASVTVDERILMDFPNSTRDTALDDNDEDEKRQVVEITDEGTAITAQFQCSKLQPDIQFVSPSHVKVKSEIEIPQRPESEFEPLQNIEPVIPPPLRYTQNAIGQLKWGGGIKIPSPPSVHPKVKLKNHGEEVMLHKAENPWKPSRILKRTFHADEAVDKEHIIIDSIVKKTCGILNKLNVGNFDSLVSQFMELQLEDKDERISSAISLVFEKAIDEPLYTAVYAKMVHTVCKKSQETSKKFRKQIIDQCQKEFQKINTDEAEIKEVEQKLQEATDEESRTQLKLELEEMKYTSRRRSLGNMRFIGELYKLKMLTPKIMVECVHLLLYSPDEENLECLYLLLTIIGQNHVQLKSLEELSQRGDKPKFIPKTKWMDRIFKQLESLSSSKKLSSRIRFAILDVVELRQNDWKSRRDINTPKIIDDSKQTAYQQKKMKVKRKRSKLPPPAKNNYGGDGDVEFREHPGGSSLPRSQLQNKGNWTTVCKTGWLQTGPIKSEPVGIRSTPIFPGLTDSFEKLMNLKIEDNVEQIFRVASCIFEKAIDIDEPLCTAVYAEMIHAFCKNSQTETAKIFRKQILDQCQKEFQKSNTDEAEIKEVEQKLEEATDEESRTQLKLELEEKKYTSRRRSLGNMRFIGELYKLKMLSPKIMVECVHLLLCSPGEENVECLCTLLTIIGQKLDIQLKNFEELSQSGEKPKFIPETKWMDRIFKQLETLLMLSGLPLNIKHLILDLIKLRTKGWKPIEIEIKNNTEKEGKCEEFRLHKELMKQPPPVENSASGGAGTHDNQNDENTDERNLEQTEVLVKTFLESTADKKAEQIASVTSTLFGNAVSSQNSAVSASYARLVHTVYTKSETHSKKFTKDIVQKCKDLINLKFVIFEVETESNWRGKRQVSSLRFIGELFKLELLRLEFFEQCFQSLIKSSDEKSLKYLCELLSICGRELDKIRPPSPWMKKAVDHLKEKFTNRMLSSTIHAEISSVLELWKNKWNPTSISNAKGHDTVGEQADTLQNQTEERVQALQMQVQRNHNHGEDGVPSTSDQRKEEEKLQICGRSSEVLNKSDIPIPSETEEAKSCSTINNRNKESDFFSGSLTGGTATFVEVLALVNKFLESPFENKVDRQHIGYIASVVFENAIASQDTAAYARIVHSVDKSKNSGSKELKKQIIIQSNNEFNAKYPTEKEKMNKEKKRAHRIRKISNVRFMGELYKLDVLSAKNIIDRSYYLLNLPSDGGENVEYLCELLTVAGEKLLTDGSVKSKIVNSLFYRISQLCGEMVLSRKIRSEITKVIRMKWKAKRDNKTVTDGCDKGSKSAHSSSQSQTQGDLKTQVVHSHEEKLNLNQTEVDGEQSKSKRPLVSVAIGDTGYPLYCWKGNCK
ncbi:unnamed protein product [Orchesella dallaii]|uniref:MIF4G domain-containing protein n=1 Tax=Orchesella dallaii TaxID=48710 RepID=A0ABP1SAD8_9HEXA